MVARVRNVEAEMVRSGQTQENAVIISSIYWRFTLYY